MGTEDDVARSTLQRAPTIFSFLSINLLWYTGAFTSGQTVAEIQAKLQNLLETYIGLIMKAGEEVPTAKLAHASELGMTYEELAR